MTAPAAARSRPAPPSHLRRDLWLIAAGLVVAWAAPGLPIDLADLLALPSGVARIFSEMYLEKGIDWSYLPNALSAMIESLQMAWVGTIIGDFAPPPQVNHGPEEVATNLMRYLGHGATLVTGPIGEPVLLAFAERRLFAVLVLTVRDNVITKIEAMVDPSAASSA